MDMINDAKYLDQKALHPSKTFPKTPPNCPTNWGRIVQNGRIHSPSDLKWHLDKN